MARDSRIRMRNGLVIPGVLLVLYGVLAIVYAEVFRSRSDFCTDSNRILIQGLCYSVRNLIIPLVVLGIGLIIAGLTAFRGKPDDLEGHLHHGTPSHVTLAVLISLVVIPAIAWAVQLARQAGGDPFELTVFGERFEHTFLLELMMLVGLLTLLPYLGLYIAVHRRREDFLVAAAASLEEPEPLPHEENFEYQDTEEAAEAQAANMVPDDDWPARRDEPEPPEAAGPGEPGEPDDGEDAWASAPTTVVGCLAKEDGRSCTNPILEGRRYCAFHACSGVTKDGRPCGNQAVEEGYCAVHRAAA